MAFSSDSKELLGDPQGQGTVTVSPISVSGHTVMLPLLQLESTTEGQPSETNGDSTITLHHLAAYESLAAEACIRVCHV